MFCASWKKKDEDKFMYMLEDCTLDLSVTNYQLFCEVIKIEIIGKRVVNNKLQGR